MKRNYLIMGLIGISLLILCSSCRRQREAQTALQEILEATVAADGPGVVLLVKSPAVGEQIFARGLSDRDEKKAVRTINHFRVVGVTKTFISTLIIQMISEGKLALTDTLAQRLPDMARNWPHSDDITIEQLLMMTSSLPDYRDNPAFWTAVLNREKRGWTPAELISYAAALPATGDPGETFHYSNTNYLLLQMILDNLLEEELNEALQDRILDRVDMPDTYLEPIAKKTGGHISGYADIDGDSLPESTLPYDDGRGLGDLGLVSNAIDLGEFAPVLYERTLPGENGRERSLKTVSMGNGDDYGLGLMRRYSSWGEMWGYASTSSGFTSQLWYLPDHDTAVVVLISGEETNLADNLVQNALTAILSLP